MLPADHKIRAEAAKRGIDLARQADRCVNYHLSRGIRRVRWLQTLVNWIDKEIEMIEERRGPVGPVSKVSSPYF